ncbi:MAG: pyrroloquinoline quinone biosynthesis peptide chaperone PqqD [Gemmatimonadales bacterium]|nr:pyrroloquinoline quinone biosynthesis peptide chaperone PqqD [Gemmatimonadales bacterium]
MTPDAVPTLWRLARIQDDAVRGRPVLLYPEGAVFLNDTGVAILELCDGRHTIADISRTLGSRYDADVTSDVREFIEHLVARELIDVA